MSTESMVMQALADRLEAIWRNKPPEMPTMIHEDERGVILSALRHNTAAQPEREAVDLDDAIERTYNYMGTTFDPSKAESWKTCFKRQLKANLAALTTPAPPSEREAALEEAALKAASQRHKRVSGIADCETLLDAYWNGCLDAAEAIRALKTTPAPAESVWGFRAKKNGDPSHDAVMEDLARRIDDE